MNRGLHGFLAMSGLAVAITLLLAVSFRLPAALYGTSELAEARIVEYLDSPTCRACSGAQSPH